jgi:protein FrlC
LELKEYGLTCTGIGNWHIYMPDESAGLVKKRMGNIKAAMNFASEAEVRNIIVYVGAPPSQMWHSPKGLVEGWGVVVERMKELAAYAESKGLFIAVENEPDGGGMTNADQLLKLIEHVGSNAVRVNFDSGNCNLAAEDVVATVRKLGRLITHTHVKDSIYCEGLLGKGPEGKWITPPLGEGTVDWKGYLLELKKIGYLPGGWLTLEYGGPHPWELGMVKGKRFIENMISELGLERD